MIKQDSVSLIHQNRVFLWIAIAAGALLFIPLIAMQFTNEVLWSLTDFIVLGFLLFGAASVFILAARRVAREHRLLIGVVCSAIFLYIWAELAVGVFTNLGS